MAEEKSYVDAAPVTAVPVAGKAAMRQHFVTFYSPGTLVAEDTTLAIDSWDVEAAKQMAKSIKERYGAIPYGFCFTTRARNAEELDSKETARSHMYYLGGKVETLDQVKARATAKDSILIGNMEGNGYDRIVTTTNGWRWTQPLRPGDVVLEWDPAEGVDATSAAASKKAEK